jgi:hypothetical protein
MDYMREQICCAGTPAPKVIGIDEISISKGHTYRPRAGMPMGGAVAALARHRSPYGERILNVPARSPCAPKLRGRAGAKSKRTKRFDISYPKKTDAQTTTSIPTNLLGIRPPLTVPWRAPQTPWNSSDRR